MELLVKLWVQAVKQQKLRDERNNHNMNKKPKRIFLGLMEIAGYYKNLKDGFHQLGVDCDFISLTPNRFNYGGSEDNFLIRWLRFLNQQRMSTPRSQVINKIFLISIINILKIGLLLYALYKYDVFIFGFKSTFFGYFELPIMKLLGKKIVYVFHGSDSRPPYINGKWKDFGADGCIALSAKQKEQIRIIEKYADVIINHLPTAQFHQRPFILWLLIGIPSQKDVEKCDEDRSDSERNCLRILHSPSHPQTKGTLAIRKAIENIKLKGYSLELIEISGKPNSVVLEELAKCDFVVDQLYSDMPMAGFATEAASYGKPAVVGGYYSQYLEKDTPKDKIPPSHYCHPDNLEQAIEKMIVDEDYRLELGRKAKTFVETYWTPKQVAQRYLK